MGNHHGDTSTIQCSQSIRSHGPNRSTRGRRLNSMLIAVGLFRLSVISMAIPILTLIGFSVIQYRALNIDESIASLDVVLGPVWNL